MHSVNYSQPHDANESGEFAHVPMTGVHRFDHHGYKQHKYEINSRPIGLTVKRTIYSVTILDASGNRLTFMSDLPSSLAAKKAAEAWIDRELRRRPIQQRTPRPKYLPTTKALEIKP